MTYPGMYSRRPSRNPSTNPSTNFVHHSCRVLPKILMEVEQDVGFFNHKNRYICLHTPQTFSSELGSPVHLAVFVTVYFVSTFKRQTLFTIPSIEDPRTVLNKMKRTKATNVNFAALLLLTSLAVIASALAGPSPRLPNSTDSTLPLLSECNVRTQFFSSSVIMKCHSVF